MKRVAAVFAILLYLMLAFVCAGCSQNKVKAAPRTNGVASQADIDQYMVEVAHQVWKNWKFEGDEAAEPFQKTAIIFKIMPDGEITDIFFATRSGIPAVDDSAYKAVAYTNPTWPFPPNIDRPFLQMGLRFGPNGLQ